MGAEDEDADINHPDNKKLSGEGWQSLREKKRGCTDCLCLLLLLACWFAMTIVGFIACGIIKNENLKSGNPNRLLSPMDYNGRLCGYADGVKNKPNGYYMASGAVVCVEKCPSKSDYEAFICYDEVVQELNDIDDDTAYQVEAWAEVVKTRCMYQAKTKSVLHRCVYNDIDANVTAAAAEFLEGNSVAQYSSGKAQSWITGFFADLYSLRAYIFGFGIGVAVFLSFVYLYFLRIPGVLFTIIWTILIGVLLCLGIGAILLYNLSVKWDDNENHSDAEVKLMRYLSYVGFAITALYLCLLLVMRKRIMLAIGIVKEAARAVAAMPILIFMPIFQAIGIVIFLVPWLIYVLFLASSGEMKVVTPNDDDEVQFRTMEYDTNTKYAFLYMLFCYFWTSQFIVALGQIVLAMSVSAWYFNRDKKEEGNNTVFWSFKTTTLYHLGTIAYGSLIIAIIKTIRAVLTYLQKKAKKSKNKVLLIILSCVQCCMWCLEKCMKFLNKNAYIQTAIHGYSFCKACRAAFFLIARNILRVIAVSMVSDFVLFLGLVFVPIATVLLCYLLLAYQRSEDSINGIIGPLICVGFLAYFVSLMFSEIFGMAINTIMCCYVADEEMFPPEQRFADGALRSAFQKSNQAAVAAKVVPLDEGKKLETADNKEGVLL